MAKTELAEHAYPLLAINPPGTDNTCREPQPDGSTESGGSTTVVSNWGTGWKTTSVMILFYVLAMATAGLHLGMFLTLDGRQTNDKRVPRQTYVAAMSTLLVNVFGTSLGISLGVAFTQYLWHLFRTRPMTVGIIEDLLGMRKDPLLLLTCATWAAAPIACASALAILLLTVAKVFPPGALTVVTKDLVTTRDTVVPIFTANYTGNGTLTDLDAHSLCENSARNSQWTCITLHPAARRISHATLSTGDVLSSSSPCGPNCTYSVAFEGPHFQCTKKAIIEIGNRIETNEKTEDGALKYYSAGFQEGFVKEPTITKWPDPKPEDILYPNFVINVSSPFGYLTDAPYGWIVNTTRLECQPGIVTYELHVSFENGVRNLSLSRRGDVRSLSELFLPSVSPPASDTEDSYRWNTKEYNNLKAVNVYAIITAMVQPLTGVLPMWAATPSKAIETITLSNGTTVTYNPDGERYFHFAGTTSLEAKNGTIVTSTYLNTNRDNMSVKAEPEIEVSADLLNEALANVTMSIFSTLSLWNTTVKATRATSRNFYSFSNPIYLFVPYGVSLIVALPFLVLGIVALCQNGVPAMEGGWLQILMTTTASQKLNKAAAGGCLGGEDNIPKALKKMRVRFGELVKSEENGSERESGAEPRVHRAGFGLADEIIPLKKRGRYGVVPE
ncbi:hypothetical protein B0T10DRAFT_560066 [Thelonectria olida]|uniref:Uncharacterized protein n=1 Tax=Thelonectria olida TaxID=1576542 RepID=A0A9P8WBH2_9HYPO|nr:hypothetical protein B0T10DRAFT_560066 [Thelonectria olida]